MGYTNDSQWPRRAEESNNTFLRFKMCINTYLLLLSIYPTCIHLAKNSFLFPIALSHLLYVKNHLLHVK